jgi:hypothetical protein
MSPPAFRATFPGVAYQLGNVRYLGAFRASKSKLIVIDALLDGIIGFGAD